MTNAGIACLLALQLALPPLTAQSSVAPPAADKLKIVILDGEGAINNIRQHAVRELRIQVNDETGRPVEGATVSLILPSQGASGTFTNGSITTTAVTDSHGQASVRAIRPNGVAGKVPIAVTASYRGRSASAVITQFNMAVEQPVRKSSSRKIAIILAVVGAAAAGGAYAGLHKSGSPTATPAVVPTITITPGTGTVGAPQ